MRSTRATRAASARRRSPSSSRCRCDAEADRAARRAVGPVDVVLAAVVIALIGFGVVMVYSASAVEATVRYHDPQFFLKRQAIYAVRRRSRSVFVVAASTTTGSTAAHVPGPRRRHACCSSCASSASATPAAAPTRWLALGPIHIQPAEMAKLALVLWLAYSLAKKAERMKTLLGRLPAAPPRGRRLDAPVHEAARLRQRGRAPVPHVHAALRGGRAASATSLGARHARRRVRRGLRSCASASTAASATSPGSNMDEHRAGPRVPAVPVGDELRLGRHVGARARQGPAGALPARGAHRLHRGDHRRGARLRRHPRALRRRTSCIVARGVRSRSTRRRRIRLRTSRSASRRCSACRRSSNLAVAMAILPTKGLTLPFLSYGGSSLLVNAAAMGILLNISRQRAPTPSDADAPPSAVRRRAERRARRRRSRRLARDGATEAPHECTDPHRRRRHRRPRLPDARGRATRCARSRPSVDVVFVGTARGIEARVVPAARLRARAARRRCRCAAAALRGVVRGALARGARRCPRRARSCGALAPRAVLSRRRLRRGPGRARGALARRAAGAARAEQRPRPRQPAARAVRRSARTSRSPRRERTSAPSVVRRYGVPLRRGFAPRAVRADGADALARARARRQPGRARAERARARARSLARRARRRPRRSCTRPAAIARRRCAQRYARARRRRRATRRAVHRRRRRARSPRPTSSSRAPAPAPSPRSAPSAAPRILVPFPHAADDHQRKNALSLATRAARRLHPPARPPTTRGSPRELDAARRRRASRAHGRAARAHGTPHAARDVARDLLDARGVCARRSASSEPRTARADGVASRSREGGRLMFRGRVRHVHFVGVGGIGMSGLAEILRTLEFDVSGSDLQARATSRAASRRSACASTSATAPRTSTAPTSSSTRARSTRDNPELVEARAARHPGDPARRDARRADAPEVRHRDRRLARQDHDHLARRHRAARRRPRSRRWSSAARSTRSARNARLGAGDLLVAEADESDGSFLRLTPTIARRHQHRPRAPRSLRHARDAEGRLRRVRNACRSTASPCSASTTRTCRTSCRASQRRHVTYGVSPAGRLPRARHPVPRARDAASTRYRRGEPLGEFTVRMPGAHNVLNALAAIAVADELEVPLDVDQAGARHASTASRAASPSSARSAASRSSTTTATTRPRSRPRSTPRSAAYDRPRRRRVPAAPLHAHAATSSTSSRARSTRPTCSSSPTSTRPARSRSPASPARRLAQAIREHGHHDVALRRATSDDLPPSCSSERAARRRGDRARRRRHQRACARSRRASSQGAARARRAASRRPPTIAAPTP